MTNAVITAQQGSTQADVGFKNRIINGDMRIDQRNNGNAITALSVYNWPVDRFRFTMGITSGATLQRVADAPAGFTHSVKLTCTTAQTPAAGQYMNFGQPIEGNNVIDLAFGTSSAKTVTLSFWVKSNLTGTFGGCLANYGGTIRSYLFQYTISTANNWEYQTVTIPGDTSGVTWPTDNTMGMYVLFSMGDGTTYQGTANTWAGADYRFASGNVRPMLTLGATWQITGVQLEIGSSATGFEYRNYGDEFQRCLRYCFQSKSYGAALGYSDARILKYEGYAKSAAYWQWVEKSFPVPMRATPTVTVSDGAGTIGRWSAWTSQGGSTANNYTPYTVYCNNNINMTISDYNNSGTYGYWCAVKAEAEL